MVISGCWPKRGFRPWRWTRSPKAANSAAAANGPGRFTTQEDGLADPPASGNAA